MSANETQPAQKPKAQATIIPVTAFSQNCTLLWCTQTMQAVVVDPGGDLPLIREAIAKTGVTVTKILITHGHMDHAAEALTLAEELGVPIEGPHEEDRFWIAQLDDDGRKWGMDAKTFEPDRWLKDGDTVTIGKLTLDVIHCPGHTPGHVVFYHAPSNFAVVGDVLFQGSIGRTDFPRGNHQQLIDSITQKLWPLGNETAFVPGHGPMSTFGHERKTNAYVSDYLLS